jgi:hypothetical protein
VFEACHAAASFELAGKSLASLLAALVLARLVASLWNESGGCRENSLIFAPVSISAITVGWIEPFCRAFKTLDFFRGVFTPVKMIGRNQLKALALLERGALTLSEAAGLADVSRQLVYAWCKSYGIDWKLARRVKLSREWEQAGRPKKRKPSKVQQRRAADAAKVEYDLVCERAANR